MMYMVYRDTLLEIYSSIEKLKAEIEKEKSSGGEYAKGLERAERLIKENLGWIEELIL